MREKEDKVKYRNNTLNKSKYFSYVKELLEELLVVNESIYLSYDRSEEMFSIDIGNDKKVISFKNGNEYNKVKKENKYFSVLWSFSNLEYSFLRNAYYSNKPIKIELLSRYFIKRYIKNNMPIKRSGNNGKIKRIFSIF